MVPGTTGQKDVSLTCLDLVAAHDNLAQFTRRVSGDISHKLFAPLNVLSGAELTDNILVGMLVLVRFEQVSLSSIPAGNRPEANGELRCAPGLPASSLAWWWYRCRPGLAVTVKIPRSCVHSYPRFLPPDVNTTGIPRQDALDVLHPPVP